MEEALADLAVAHALDLLCDRATKADMLPLCGGGTGDDTLNWLSGGGAGNDALSHQALCRHRSASGSTTATPPFRDKERAG